MAVTQKTQKVWRAFIDNLKESRKHPGVFRLLLSYYFFSDAIATLSLFSAIYLQKVFGIGDAQKAGILLLIIVGVAVGAFVGGYLADKFSHRKILRLSLMALSITIIIVSLNHTVELLQIIFLLFGLTMGLVYATSRSYLASLVPKEESGTFFGLYTFAERCASIIGPLVWGILIFVFANITPTNYRIAAFAMGIFALCGALPFLTKQKAPDKETAV